MNKFISFAALIIVACLVLGSHLTAFADSSVRREPQKPSFPAEMPAPEVVHEQNVQKPVGGTAPRPEVAPEQIAKKPSGRRDPEIAAHPSATVVVQPALPAVAQTAPAGVSETSTRNNVDYQDRKMKPAIEVKSSTFATPSKIEAPEPSRTAAVASEPKTSPTPRAITIATKPSKSVARQNHTAVSGRIVGGTANYVFIKKADGSIVSVPRNKIGRRHVTATRKRVTKATKPLAEVPKRHIIVKTENTPDRSKPAITITRLTQNKNPLKIVAPPDLFEDGLKRFEDIKREDLAAPKRESFYSIKKEEMAPLKKTPEPEIAIDTRTLIYTPERPDPSRNDNDEGSLFN